MYPNLFFIAAASLDEKAKEFLNEQAPIFAKNIVFALLIFFVGRILISGILSMTDKVMEKSKVEDTLKSFIRALIKITLMVVVILAALEQIGVKTTSFVAILAAAGLAIGMALKDTLGNFASGVMIILFKPYKVGHFVEVAGTSGVIEEVNLFNTVLRTGDNVQMFVPNGSITGGKISNYSTKPTRRIDLVIGCGYDDDIKAVKEALESIVSSHEKVLSEPEPTVAVSNLGDNSVDFVVRPWVDNGDYWPVRFELIEQIKLMFDEKGFSIPYPQRDIHVYNEK
ncbi:MAG: mechanosensitive ion channel [Lentisphaeraceae bacterium]|nr:mechanosensitive ion channel [Lentisphaeraceae bacterium]